MVLCPKRGTNNKLLLAFVIKYLTRALLVTKCIAQCEVVLVGTLQLSAWDYRIHLPASPCIRVSTPDSQKLLINNCQMCSLSPPQSQLESKKAFISVES